jgi:hypothetical protein
MLWLRGKAARDKDELVATELQKLFVHLLRPLGVAPSPETIAEAVALYRAARDDAQKQLGCAISGKLEAEVAPALLADERK